MHNIDLSLDEITKVEGAASLTVKVRNGRVENVEFAIREFKRFYTQAMRGKPYVALPQLLARICGTCSNAHLLCSIESCEKALGISPSEQSMVMKRLTVAALLIRDHALHLYLFALPDIYGKDNFLEFDENDEEQHQLLHDAFAIKAAGNYLAEIIAGRSVHAINPVIGGFLKVPDQVEVTKAKKKLEDVRPAVLRLIDILKKCEFKFDRQTHYMALVGNPFTFLEGEIKNDSGAVIAEGDWRDHLERVVIPYSQASGYQYRGESFMVGALARLNLSKNTLHEKTRQEAKEALKLFPSTNVFHNNLAQAIEILHSLDSAVEMLSNTEFKQEPPAQPTRKYGLGVGVVEAPRGTLYHRVQIGEDGKVATGAIVVPTGQNQVNIEQDVGRRIEELLPQNLSQAEIQLEMEKLIRAYDPCMSCASHFLKMKWA
ncbi:MAG: nickel-dependent hydrogenase large subunit [bacterium]